MSTVSATVLIGTPIGIFFNIASYPRTMTVDIFPLLIVELARAKCDPSKVQVVAVLDAIGIMFLANRNIPANTVEMAWLARHASDLVTFANTVIGDEWEQVVPEAASVLRAAQELHVGEPRDVSDAHPAAARVGSGKVQRFV